MFTTLLESKGSRKADSRWLPASALIHASLLAGLLTHSRTVQGVEPDAHEPPRIIWVAPPQPGTNASTASGTAGSAARSTGAERRMPRFDGAPPVDLPDIAASLPGTALGDEDILSPTTVIGAPGGNGLSSGRDSGPRWAAQVEKVALPLPGNPLPAYPGILRSAGIEGSVTLRFVIDTTGAVERGSEVVLHSDHDLFTAETLRTLRMHRFLPAEVGGMKVRMLVEQRFEFTFEAGRQ